jgi:hypothetical protein
MRHIKQGDSSSALFWFVYWGGNLSRRSRYTTLFPVLFYSGQEDVSSFLLTPLFFYRANRWHLNSGERKVQGSSLFISPFFYRRTLNEDSSASLLWIFYWGGSATGDRGYSTVLPVFFYSGKENSSSFLLIPLFFYSANRWHLDLGEGKAQASSLFISPFFYRRTLNEDSSASLLWLLYWGGDKKSDQRYSGFFPLYYYSREADFSRFLLTPFFVYVRKTDPENKNKPGSSFFLSPLYMHHLDNGDDDTALLWLAYWGGNTTHNSDYRSLLPFFYYAGRSDKSAFLLTPLFLYSSARGASGDPQAVPQSQFYFLSPLFSYERVNTNYSASLFWLIYWGGNPNTNREYNMLFPLFYHSHTPGRSRYVLTPLFLYDSSTTETDSGEDSHGKKYSASFLWLTYWGNNRGSSYFLLFPLLYASAERDNSLQINSPLFRYTSSEPNSYTGNPVRYLSIPIIPLIWFDSKPYESDFSVAYLIRHRRFPSSHTSYAFPLYYYNKEANSRFGVFLFPLVWHWGNAQESRWLFLPLLYSAKTATSDLTLSPLYYESSGEKSQFSMFIPFYINYADEKYSFHLNLSGISLSEEQLTSLPFSTEIGREKILVDWDFGWLYNFVRFSSRTTIKLQTPLPPDPVTVQKREAELRLRKGKMLRSLISPYDWEGTWDTPPLSEPESPKLVNRRERNRKDSEDFFGSYFLFGILAYEKADHYRHFRLLPLSWLTWGTTEAEKVQMVFPVYLRYTSPSAEYLAIFPFYGHQEKTSEEMQKKDNTCRDTMSAVLVLLYWSEYECQTNRSEKTILWPLFNSYVSHKGNGTRLFPLFWAKSRPTMDTIAGWHFSLLHHTSYDGDFSYTKTWLFYYNSRPNGASFGLWGLLHFGRNASPGSFTGYIFPVYYTGTDYYSGYGNNQSLRKSTLTIAGIFWRLRDGTGSVPRIRHFSPLYYYEGTSGEYQSFYTWGFYYIDSADKQTLGIPLLLHRRYYTDRSFSSLFLTGFYFSSEVSYSGEKETVAWLFPCFIQGRPGTPELIYHRFIITIRKAKVRAF